MAGSLKIQGMGGANTPKSSGIGGLLKRDVKKADYLQPEFDSLSITEIVNDSEVAETQIILRSTFMPHTPFSYGGEQRIKKEYYPGNPEPVVQILGPQEDDVTIKGRLKTKFLSPNQEGINEDQRLNADELRQLAILTQEELDAMRLRGNLVQISLGNVWKRYGFIQACKFELVRLVDISYEINFSIVGFNKPENCKFADSSDNSPQVPNSELKSKAAAYLDEAKKIPESMPRSISELINDQINKVASVVADVTGFVDGVVGEAEAVAASANRAIGLIKHARATISRTSRRIGQVATSVSSLGSSVTSEFGKTSETVKNARHLHKTKGYFFDLSALLATLQARFQAVAKTIPQRRHLVRQGDTLQSLSVKYYNTADNWKVIADHNKLLTTELVVGSVLEIPRV